MWFSALRQARGAWRGSREQGWRRQQILRAVLTAHTQAFGLSKVNGDQLMRYALTLAAVLQLVWKRKSLEVEAGDRVGVGWESGPGSGLGNQVRW